jgi:hypothetical protein
MGVSIAVMLLASFVMIWLADWTESSSIHRFEIVGRILALLPPFLLDVGMYLAPTLAVPALGVDCFLRLKRNPLTVTRNLWFLVASIFILGAAMLPTALENEGWSREWSGFGYTGGPVNLSGLFSLLASLRFNFLMFVGFSMTLLAGELSHVARQRLMDEEYIEAMGYTARELDRISRRHRLILAVCSPSQPVFSLLSRLTILLVMPWAATHLIISLHMAKVAEAFDALPIVVSDAVARERGFMQVIIEPSGQVLFDGVTVAQPNDKVCHSLAMRLRQLTRDDFPPPVMNSHPSVLSGYTSSTVGRIGLIVAPDVPAERVFEVLAAIHRGSWIETVFVDAAIP